jgi:signal peptidase II
MSEAVVALVVSGFEHSSFRHSSFVIRHLQTRYSMLDVPRNRYIVFALIALAGFAADLVTKAIFFSWTELYGGHVYWLWPEYAGIQLSWNRGALFGVGQGGWWFFAALSVLAAGGILAWLFWFGAARQMWVTVALGCVMAGILGNLYDRLGLPDKLWPGRAVDIGQPVHAVRDWILVRWDARWTWPNFNIADSLLVVGAIALVLESLRKPPVSGDVIVDVAVDRSGPKSGVNS